MIIPTLIILILFIIMVNYSLVMNMANQNNQLRKEALPYAFLPAAGVMIYKKKELSNLSAIINGKPYVKQLLNYGVILGYLWLSIYMYQHQWMIVNMLGILFLAVSLFVHQSVTVSIADKRGYNLIKAGLIGLVPIAGLVYYLVLPSRRNIIESTVKKTYSFKELFGRFFIYTEMSVLVFVVLVPIIYILGAALTNSSEIPYTIWPSEISWRNFDILFSQTWERAGTTTTINVYYLLWFKNTLMIAVVNMILSVLFITGAAYVFARFRFKGKKFGLLAIMVLQMFPTFLGLVAIYTLFDTLGLLGKPLALVIIYTGGAVPFNIWLIKGFMQGIPKDLDESATIDGANKIQIFFKIILPLSLPIVTFVAVGQFMGPWLDYILPSYILRGTGAEASKNWTLAVGLFRFLQQGDPMYRPTLFAAGALLIAIPITILYVTFQKYLIEGITAGASKG